MKIISRSEAKASSLKKYFTGKPCKHGHISERRVSTGSCISCCKANQKKEYQSRKNNPDRAEYMRSYLASYDHKNKRDCKSRYYQKNKANILEKSSAYRSDRRGFYNMLCQQRRERIVRATPKSLTDEMKSLIRSIYERCGEMNKENKNSYHVDHIVPIAGNGVCGLHVPWNLQILKADENLKKSNRVDYA